MNDIRYFFPKTITTIQKSIILRSKLKYIKYFVIVISINPAYPK